MKTEQIEVLDLGDATEETRQAFPIPPYYSDSTYLFGIWPNLID